MTKRVSWSLATLTAITATMVVSSATYASGDAYISAATSCFASPAPPGTDRRASTRPATSTAPPSRTSRSMWS